MGVGWGCSRGFQGFGDIQGFRVSWRVRPLAGGSQGKGGPRKNWRASAPPPPPPAGPSGSVCTRARKKEGRGAARRGADLEPLARDAAGVDALLPLEGHRQLQPHLGCRAHAQLVEGVLEHVVPPHREPQRAVVAAWKGGGREGGRERVSWFCGGSKCDGGNERRPGASGRRGRGSGADASGGAKRAAGSHLKRTASPPPRRALWRESGSACCQSPRAAAPAAAAPATRPAAPACGAGRR